VVGLESFFFGCLAQVFCDYSGQSRQRWTTLFRYTPTVLLSFALVILGAGLTASVIVHYLSHSFTLPPAPSVLDHLGVTGILFMIIGFSTFGFTLVLHATGVRYGSVTSETRSQA